MKRPLLSKSSLMAVGLAAAAAVWMLSGLGGASTLPQDDEREREGAAPASTGTAEPDRAAGGLGQAALQDGTGVPVTVQRSTAEVIVRHVVFSGRTEPNRSVEIKAETEGRVVELGADRGTAVTAGERIVSLDVRDRDARIQEAEALIAQHELQYEAAKQLEGRQLVSEAQIAEAYARLISARADLEQIRLDLQRTTIEAPFDGMLEDRMVELGDYVGIGDSVALIVDNDPLIAVGEVSEREIGTFEVGNVGRTQLVNGEIIEGTVRYISPVADQNTRTFRVELAIPNSGHALPAGMTTEVRLPASEIEAHFVSPALLTLDDAGNIGVKTVDAQDKVRFHTVEVVRSASDGVWITGLPDEALIITIGQGFVAVGQTVQAVPADRHQ